MTVQATFVYCLDPATCRVQSVGISWGAVHGVYLRGAVRCCVACCLRGATLCVPLCLPPPVRLVLPSTNKCVPVPV